MHIVPFVNHLSVALKSNQPEAPDFPEFQPSLTPTHTNTHGLVEFVTVAVVKQTARCKSLKPIGKLPHNLNSVEQSSLGMYIKICAMAGFPPKPPEWPESPSAIQFRNIKLSNQPTGSSNGHS